MLSKLLNLDSLDLKNIEFKRVEVWKQWARINLCVEVDAVINNIENDMQFLSKISTILNFMILKI